MDELTVDTLEATELSEPQLVEVSETIELVRPERKRESGYARMKARANYLSKDITTLEGILETLLKSLERAISPDITDQDRSRYRRMVNEIRGHLANKE